MEIVIAGGGWYGCHLALTLSAEYNVTIVEKNEEIFRGASLANQNRTHLGAHYPRCHKTRMEARQGFDLFMERYGSLTETIPCNVYAVVNDISMVDYQTYVGTLRSDGMQCIEIKPEYYGLKNCEGAILTAERLIRPDRAKNYFEEKLKGKVKFEVGIEIGKLEKNEKPDFLIDCTYGALGSPEVDHYEPCALLIARGTNETAGRAVTLMDSWEVGASMMPWIEEGLVTLTSVKYTPLTKCSTYNEAIQSIKNQTPASIEERFKKTKALLSTYYPAVEELRLEGVLYGIRQKPKSVADQRTFLVSPVGERQVQCLPGKITSIFAMEAKVRQYLLDLVPGGVD